MNKNILLLIALTATILTTAQISSGLGALCDNLDAGEDIQLNCVKRDTLLTASIIAPELKSSRRYVVNGESHCLYEFEGARTRIVNDDYWSCTPLPLENRPNRPPFVFCFFENQYSQVLVSSNGIVSFDLTMAGELSNWDLQGVGMLGTNGNQNIQTNAIFGVLHDMDSRYRSDEPTYNAIAVSTYGEYPNRKCVISFNVYQYSCGGVVNGLDSACNDTTNNNITTYYDDNQLSKSEIILYESTNVIDVVIGQKPQCAWNENRAIVGIQNRSGTISYVAPGRDNTGNWNVEPGATPDDMPNVELWRFVPDGLTALPYQFRWLDPDGNVLNVDADGNLTNDLSTRVEPNIETEYTAELTLFDRCNNSDSIIIDTVTVTPGFNPTITDPNDIESCEDPVGTGNANFNLDQNNLILNGLPPSEYLITYYNTETDAENGNPATNNPITTLNPYVSSGSETIWVRIEDVNDSTCFVIRSFDLSVIVDSIDISYPSNAFCSNNTTTVLPDSISITGGSFFINNGGIIDAITGEIDIVSSGLGSDNTGNFIVTYQIIGTNCTVNTDFNISIYELPDVDEPLNITENACGSFTLPVITGSSLTGNQAYYTGSGGTGVSYPADGTTIIYYDPSITYPITFYLYDETNTTPNCSDEENFQLTIYPSTTATAPTSNLNACDDGTGTAEFNTINFTSEILGNLQLPTDFTINYSDQNGTTLEINPPLPFVYTFASGESNLEITATVINNTTLCEQTVNFTLIKDNPDVSAFIYPASNICENDNANPFPLFTNETLLGGTFSILNVNGVDDGATIAYNTGEINLNTTIAGETYIISYDSTGAVNSFCPTISTFEITIDTEVFADFTYPDTILCIDAENPVPVLGASSLAGGNFSINPTEAYINTMSGIIDLSTTEAGTTYTISYTTPNTSACSDTKTFDITIIALPEFELSPQAYLCPDQSFVELSIENPADTYTYEWINAEDIDTVIGIGETYNATEVGIYAVIATESINQCTSTQIISVGMAEQALITNVTVNDFNRPNNSITVEVTGGTGDFTYYLIDSDGNEIINQVNNPVFENILPGTYEIRVEDNQNCSLTIYRTNITILDYPRFFTPNGDGAYEYWQINDASIIPNSKILIFDRFGKILAQIDPNSPGWNGIYLGKQVPATDYWFTAKYLDPNTQLPRTVQGHFSIVRKKPF